MLRHLLHLAHAAVHERAKRSRLVARLTGEPRRSSRWPAVERAWLAEHPSCAACGGDERVQVHHVQPVHLHPEMELDARNLLTLCMGPRECHLALGHGGCFRSWNPNVREDVVAALHHPERRAEIVARARATRMA